MGTGVLRTSGRLLVSLLLPFASRAEEVELPPVVVPLPEQSMPQSPSRRDASGAVTVVKAQGGEARDAAELLATSPGVVVHESGGLGQSKRVSLRGAAPNGTLVLLDGIPLNGGGGNVDLSRIPAAVVERFEVLRGGSRFGSGALGGVVNVVTRRPERAARAFAEATFGSFQTSLLHAGATGPLGGGQGLLLLHGARSDGRFDFLYDELPELDGNPLETRVRENNDAAFGGALVKYRRPIGPSAFAEGMAELSLESRGLAGPAANPTGQGRQSSRRAAGFLRLSKALPSGEVGGFLWGKQDALSLLEAVPGYALYEQLDQAVGAEVTFESLVGGCGLFAAASASYEWMREPSSANPAWPKVSALIGGDVFLLGGALVLSPSMRVDQSGPFTGLSPKLGATYALTSALSVRANAGQSHRAPSFLELYVHQGFLWPNPSLRPERALYADAALLFETARSKGSIGGFYSLYEDLISYELSPLLGARPFNFMAARVFGLEAEAEWAGAEWLSALASYTLLFSQNLKDEPRYYLKELPFRPRHKLYARVSVGPAIARGRFEVLYQSEQLQNRTGTVSLPARTFVNAGLSSELVFRPKVQASIELKNLLDVRTQDVDGYPLPPRAAYLTVTMTHDFETSTH